MQLLIFIAVALLSLVLVAVGLHYSLKKKGEEEELKAMQHNSGFYSIVRVSPRETVLRLKPTADDVEKWLQSSYPHCTAEQRIAWGREWEDAVEASIALIEKGDREGRNTFRYEVPPEEHPLLPFIVADGYITRETIYEHPELLPPFFVGCKTRLMLKEADSTLRGESAAKSGWKPMLPSPDGKYPIPDWRFIPEHLA